MADEDVADVFAIPDFWKSSKWLDLSRQGQSEFFKLDFASTTGTKQSSDINSTPPNATSEEFFRVPTVLGSLDWNLQVQARQHEQPAHALCEPLREDTDLFNDAFIRNAETPRSTAEYQSWDGFVMPDIPAAVPLFMTECGPAAYDAALDSTDDPLGVKNDGHKIVETHPYLTALLALLLGRSSIFFKWSEQAGSFVQDLDRLRISGYSADVLSGLQTRCIECGNNTRFLHTFVQITYKTHSSAGRVALAKAVDTLLLAIQTKLGVRARKMDSLLRLQSLMDPVYTILSFFGHLVTKLNKSRTDEQMLSVLFAETQALEHGDNLLSAIMREILASVSEPWLDFTQKWMGILSEEGNPITKNGPGKSFVKVEDVAYMDDFGLENEEPDYILDERRMPAFVPGDLALTIFETGKTLRLLRAYHAEHPLCQVDVVRSNIPPSLDWQYDWQSIQELRKKVNEYETSLLQTISNPESGTHNGLPANHSVSQLNYGLQFFGQEENQLATNLLASIEHLNQPLPPTSVSNRLSQLLHDRLFGDEHKIETAGLDLVPHWSLLPLLSFGPLVEAQARLVNREYMKLLFTSHGLRDHLCLQKDFQLLGSGLFCSRLSHALFDSDLETAERQAGVARTGGVMGLRLGSRETWPPASSELRLALMGVLTESYTSASQQAGWGREQHKLPGDLSFAVRDLADDEIEKCLNPGSLEALDFLRLTYKPPPQLALIITPTILLKYDKVFRLLLRILRMLYVVGELHRDVNGRTSRWHNVSDTALRFRIEAQYFVSSVTRYFFDTGIGLPWRRFENWLEKVQLDLQDENLADQGAPVVSPNQVREYHDQILDSVMHTLLLRKRQQPVLQVLDDIFTTILRFSKFASIEAKSVASADGSVPQLYGIFKKKVNVFITVCRGLSERGGHHTRLSKTEPGDDGRPGMKEESTIDRLLLQLEMSGYYGGTSHERM